MVLLGIRWVGNMAGNLIASVSLSCPASTTRIDSEESAAASLPAITQPAVPPDDDWRSSVIRYQTHERGKGLPTASDDDIHLLWELLEATHLPAGLIRGEGRSNDGEGGPEYFQELGVRDSRVPRQCEVAGWGGREKIVQ